MQTLTRKLIQLINDTNPCPILIIQLTHIVLGAGQKIPLMWYFALTVEGVFDIIASQNVKKKNEMCPECDRSN